MTATDLTPSGLNPVQATLYAELEKANIAVLEAWNVWEGDLALLYTLYDQKLWVWIDENGNTYFNYHSLGIHPHKLNPLTETIKQIKNIPAPVYVAPEPSHVCAVCDKPISLEFNDNVNEQYTNASEFTGHGTWGSDFDMEGPFSIQICDECLKGMTDRGAVKIYEQSRPTPRSFQTYKGWWK